MKMFQVKLFLIIGSIKYLVHCRSFSNQLPENLLDQGDSVEEAAVLPCSTKDDNGPQSRNGLIGSRYRWAHFNVYADPTYSDQERVLLSNALDRLREVLPCVNFEMYSKDVSPSGDYIHIKKLNGCWSHVGKRGGAQEMSLQSPGCMGRGIILHEMIHALGFYHEQSRPDRDDHVTVLWQNILPGMEHNFNKYSSSQVTSFGVPYNSRSIMHYGPRDFSANGNPTLISKNGDQVGSRGDLQQSDIEKLRSMYNC